MLRALLLLRQCSELVLRALPAEIFRLLRQSLLVEASLLLSSLC